MRRALIVVDVQNDFCPGGSLAVAGGDEVAAGISRWLEANEGRYDLVVASMDWHPVPGPGSAFPHFSDDPDYATTWPVHCVEGTKGAALHPALVLPAGTVVVRKGQASGAYSAFEGSDDHGRSLADILRSEAIGSVDVVGLATDHCVRATALDAKAAGLDVCVLGSLTAGVAPESTADALDEFRAAGVAVRDAQRIRG